MADYGGCANNGGNNGSNVQFPQSSGHHGGNVNNGGNGGCANNGGKAGNGGNRYNVGIGGFANNGGNAGNGGIPYNAGNGGNGGFVHSSGRVDSVPSWGLGKSGNPNSGDNGDTSGNYYGGNANIDGFINGGDVKGDTQQPTVHDYDKGGCANTGKGGCANNGANANKGGNYYGGNANNWQLLRWQCWQWWQWQWLSPPTPQYATPSKRSWLC